MCAKETTRWQGYRPSDLKSNALSTTPLRPNTIVIVSVLIRRRSLAICLYSLLVSIPDCAFTDCARKGPFTQDRIFSPLVQNVICDNQN